MHWHVNMADLFELSLEVHAVNLWLFARADEFSYLEAEIYVLFFPFFFFFFFLDRQCDTAKWCF